MENVQKQNSRKRHGKKNALLDVTGTNFSAGNTLNAPPSGSDSATKAPTEISQVVELAAPIDMQVENASVAAAAAEHIVYENAYSAAVPPYTIEETPASQTSEIISEPDPRVVQSLPPIQPCISDPGNGPRVVDIDAFFVSPFADPIATTDPNCLSLSSVEVVPVLLQVLPRDTALITWYNSTRAFSRICPACRRIYQVGDELPPHLDNGMDKMRESPQTRREQAISGLCSWMCFALATYRYPGSINAWGRMAEDMDDALIQYLNGPGDPRVPDEEGLGQLLRMTRNERLGLDELRPPMAAYLASLNVPLDGSAVTIVVDGQ